ncbi:sensor histidine kinase [Cyclobacterium sediminis]
MKRLLVTRDKTKEFYYIEWAISLIALLFGVLVILGWFYNVSLLQSLINSFTNLKINTALIISLSGLHMVINLIYESRNLIILKSLSFLIFAIGAFTLSEYFNLFPFSIDNILKFDNHSNGYPGRMAPSTAICSILLGCFFWVENSKRRLVRRIGVFSLMFIIALTMVGIIAFMEGVSTSERGIFFSTMALSTCIVFFSISSIKLVNNPNANLIDLIAGKHQGSVLVRKTIPLLVLFPILFNYLFMWGVNSNYISSDLSLISFASIIITLSILYISFLAVGFNEESAKREKAESDLKNNNLYLKQFKEGLDRASIVAITDKKGVITYVNDVFCKISKYSKGELIGNTHAIINSGYHSQHFFRNMWKTISSGDIWVDEIKNKAKDGSYYWVLTAIVPFKDENNQITEYMALRQDITDRKVAIQVKLDSIQKLEYKNRELEQFAYIASHDLQEPLQTILNYTSLLSSNESNNLDELEQQSMLFIQEAAGKMRKLIHGLLEYNLLGKNLENHKIDTQKLIKEVIEEVNNIIITRKATVEVLKLPPIYGHKASLKLLFENLILNGIKFSKEDRLPKITISGEQVKDQVVISVKDNGIGIDKKYHEKIFDIFQRINKREAYEGLGIGLSYCRKITELHGGKIWVESTLNEGSVFKVLINQHRND